MKLLLQLFAASAALPFASTFTIHTRHASKPIGSIASASPSTSAPRATPTRRGFGTWRLPMTSDGDGDAATQSPRKRRKRKDGKQFSPPPSSAQPETDDAEVAVATVPEPEEEAPSAEPPSPPKQNVVVMQVRDVRDVVSGAPESPLDLEEDDEELEDDDDELADDEEWEYYDVDEDGNEIIASNERIEGRPRDDSMEQLLADARQFRSSNADGQMSNAEEESSMKDTIFNVISTVVTIDFFVVIGLLLWFLAGIFCSTVLKDDAVQIAFNMNFERVTQPALGILMIGAVVGSLGNKDEEE